MSDIKIFKAYYLHAQVDSNNKFCFDNKSQYTGSTHFFYFKGNWRRLAYVEIGKVEYAKWGWGLYPEVKTIIFGFEGLSTREIQHGAVKFPFVRADSCDCNAIKENRWYGQKYGPPLQHGLPNNHEWEEYKTKLIALVNPAIPFDWVNINWNNKRGYDLVMGYRYFIKEKIKRNNEKFFAKRVKKPS